MQTLARARKVGGSLMVRIPPEIIEQEHIKQDEILSISVEKVKKDGFGIFKGIGSFTKEDELDTHE